MRVSTMDMASVKPMLDQTHVPTDDENRPYVPIGPSSQPYVTVDVRNELLTLQTERGPLYFSRSGAWMLVKAMIVMLMRGGIRWRSPYPT